MYSTRFNKKTMTTQTIQAVIGVFTSLVIPLVISKWTSLKWTSGQKEALLLALAIVGGALNVALDGKLVFSDWEAIVQTALAIYAGARGTYQFILKGLGLEKVIDPKEALVSEGKEQVKNTLRNISVETAKAVLDEDNRSAVLKVTTTL